LRNAGIDARGLDAVIASGVILTTVTDVMGYLSSSGWRP